MLLAVALSSDTWELDDSPKYASIILNGTAVGRLDLFTYELNSNNLQADISSINEGVHEARVELHKVNGSMIASVQTILYVGYRSCPYLCDDPVYCPHPPDSEESTRDFRKMTSPYGGCNLAFNQMSTMSSLQDELSHDVAVDGRMTIGHDFYAHNFVYSQVQRDPWWAVDLQREENIQSIGIWWSVNVGGKDQYPQAWPINISSKVMVSIYNDDGNVTGRYTIEPPADPSSRTISFIGGHHDGGSDVLARGRFVKVAMQGEGQLGLREVQLYGSNCWDCSKHCINGYCAHNANGEMRCVCDPDWIGYDCSTHIFTDIEFYPPPSSLDEMKDAWQDPEDWEAALADIQRQMHPEDCTPESSQLFYFPNAGFASTMQFLAGLINLALARNKCTVISSLRPWVYALDHPTCKRRGDFSCYLRPLFSCPLYNSTDPNEETRRVDPYIPAVYVPETLVEHFYYVPPRYKKHGILWWRAVQMEYILRLNEETRREVDLDNVKRSINYTHPIIGLHVRRGDSCHTTLRRNKCVPLSRHLEHVRAMASRYNISKVFVATDDTQVVKELSRAEPQLSFISIQSYDRTSLQSGDAVWLENRLGAGELSGHELTLFTLRDLMLLAQADAIVGHFSSNLSRLAFLRSLARHGHAVPYASVDGPWCFHWRMCCQVSASFPFSTVC
uniref:Alpha-(1,6)-fucosyltransferase N- and catalytic domain-containing protein n=1 Tax=Hanusia phi TaxID=3032 RepID=A0A7S0EQH3_9CRYP